MEVEGSRGRMVLVKASCAQVVIEVDNGGGRDEANFGAAT